MFYTHTTPYLNHFVYVSLLLYIYIYLAVYADLPINITVDSCDTTCVNITIKDDSVLGMNKTFYVILKTNDTSIPEPEKGKVIIIDNEGEDSLLMYCIYTQYKYWH